MAERNEKRVARRTFFKGCLAAGGTLLAGGIGYRLLDHWVGTDMDVARTEALLDAIEPAAVPGSLPNIIVILADDLGYGDLSCYGSPAIRTPHLDRMAAEGARLTSAYSTAPVCSPARAGLLTGRYPIRAHVAMPYFPAGALMDVAFTVSGTFPHGVRGIPVDEALLPQLLQRRGYRTGMLGKWHLGDRSPHLPNERGFDSFYGVYYPNDVEPYAVYRDREVEIPAPADQSMLTQNLTREALSFIAENRGRPFFLYYAQPMPHHPVHASEAFRGTSRAGLYGDAVEEIDWSVGEILSSLKQHGLDERTSVIFTSDNGPWWQGNPGLTRGRKNLPFEGGYLAPFIARWPGVIPANSLSDEMSMNFDIFATCLAVAGVPSPSDRVIDGVDILPLLCGESRPPHETLYFYKSSRLIGVRQENWKYMRRHMTDNGGYATLHHGPFLFNLERDPNESYSLIESEPQVAATLEAMLDDWDAEMRRNVRGWL